MPCSTGFALKKLDDTLNDATFVEITPANQWMTLYIPPVIDVEADARVGHTHWGGRRRRILQRRWFLVEDCG